VKKKNKPPKTKKPRILARGYFGDLVVVNGRRRYVKLKQKEV